MQGGWTDIALRAELIEERPSVLVIDPSPAQRSETCLLLQRCGLIAHEAADADAAWHAVAQQRYSLVFVDLGASLGSPFQFIDRLRRWGGGTHVIGLGANAGRDELLGLLRSGATDYLDKPVGEEQLRDVLRRVIGGAHRESPPPPFGTDSFVGPALRGGDEEGSETDEKPTPTPEMLVDGVVSRLRTGQVELPAISGRIRDLMARSTCGVDEVLEVLLVDPSMVSAILMRANTADLGTARAVTSPRRACLLLGDKRVLAIAQEVLLYRLFGLGEVSLNEVTHRMWRNVVVTAHGCRALAEHMRRRDADEMYLAGLLHNIGELFVVSAILQEHPAGTLPTEVWPVLADRLEDCHESVGSALLASWRMPAGLVRLARAHHGPAVMLGRGERTTRALVQLSWATALRLGFTYLPNQEAPELAPLLEELRLDEPELIGLFKNAHRWVSAV